MSETHQQSSRDHVVHRSAPDSDRARFGGVKFGVAFFGWLTATGMLVLLTALVTAAGAALGVATGTDVQQATSKASENPETIGVVGAIAVAVILLLAYYCGGYVAGRMARFDGAKQGFAVWVWAVLIAVAVGVLGAVAGNKYDIFSGEAQHGWRGGVGRCSCLGPHWCRARRRCRDALPPTR
jgi:hypothetical protein